MVVAGKLLDEEHKLQTAVFSDAFIDEPDVTLSFDAWKNIARTSLLAWTVLTARSRRAFTYDVQDVSADRKNGQAMALLIQQQIQKLKADYKCNVVAIVSDAAGEVASARRLVQAALPELISLHCFSHQTNLIVAGTRSTDATTIALRFLVEHPHTSKYCFCLQTTSKRPRIEVMSTKPRLLLGSQS